MELLIAVTDHGPEINHIKVGEVITCQPDGWGWTNAELNHPWWRIVRAPILPTHANTLIQQHTPLEFRNKIDRFPLKKYIIDLTKLGTLIPGGIVDVTNGQLISATKLA